MTPLGSATEERLASAFTQRDLADARRWLEEDLSESVAGLDSIGLLERVRIAAIKASDGTLPGLVDAIVLAQTDFRDLLVRAGFAEDVEAHLRWWPT